MVRCVSCARHATQLAAAERLMRIGGQLGLGPDDPRPRAQRADGGGDPGDEATATDRDHDLVGIGAVRGDLQADGALARNHGPVIEGRDERIAVPADQFVGGRHPRRQRRLVVTIRAPSRRTGSSLTGGALSGTTTVAGTPSRAAA